MENVAVDFQTVKSSSEKAEDQMISSLASMSPGYRFSLAQESVRVEKTHSVKAGKLDYMFRNVEDILSVASPALSKYGLYFVFDDSYIVNDQGVRIGLASKIVIKDGFSDWEISSGEAYSPIAAPTDPKQYGTAQSYAHKYACASIFPLGISEDYDSKAPVLAYPQEVQTATPSEKQPVSDGYEMYCIWGKSAKLTDEERKKLKDMIHDSNIVAREMTVKQAQDLINNIERQRKPSETTSTSENTPTTCDEYPEPDFPDDDNSDRVNLDEITDEEILDMI